MTQSVNQESIEEMRARLLGDSEVREMISMRAYELYLGRQSEAGREVEDWLRAENEILTLLVQEELRSQASYPIVEPVSGGGVARPSKPKMARKKSAGSQSGKAGKPSLSEKPDNSEANISSSNAESALQPERRPDKTSKRANVAAANKSEAPWEPDNVDKPIKPAAKKAGVRSNARLKTPARAKTVKARKVKSAEDAESKKPSSKGRK